MVQYHILCGAIDSNLRIGKYTEQMDKPESTRQEEASFYNLALTLNSARTNEYPVKI